MSNINSNSKSDFGKNLLLKYGWSEGKGLGKNENGLIEPIEAKVKVDNTGIGFQKLNENWWETIMNEKLKNIQIDQSPDKVAVQLINKDEESTSLANKKHSMVVKPFVTSSTLQNGNLLGTSSFTTVLSSTVQQKSKHIFNISDEELVKACGGRTGHKGARHGLGMTGKLTRIEEQNKILNISFQNGLPSTDVFTHNLSSVIREGLIKNKTNILEESSENDIEPLDTDLPSILPCKISPALDSTTKQRNHRKRMKSLVTCLEKMCNINDKSKIELKQKKECQQIENLMQCLKTKFNINDMRGRSSIEGVQKKRKEKNIKMHKAFLHMLNEYDEPCTKNTVSRFNYVRKSDTEKQKKRPRRKNKRRQNDDDIKSIASTLEHDYAVQQRDETQSGKESCNTDNKFCYLLHSSKCTHLCANANVIHDRCKHVICAHTSEDHIQVLKAHCKKVKKKKKKKSKKQAKKREILKYAEEFCSFAKYKKTKKLSHRFLKINSDTAVLKDHE